MIEARQPRDWLRDACRRWGESEVAIRCAALLSGASPYDDAELVRYIGGPHGAAELRTGRLEERGQLYWPRSWGARGLLYAWDESAAPAVVAALADEAWRVREMAAKVVALREVGAAAEALAFLLDDEVPRVRAAAARALGFVGETEHAPALAGLAADPEPQVRLRAEQALIRMSTRLDRDLSDLRAGTAYGEALDD